MTKEDKELLLRDLCARSLYGVMADYVGECIKIKYINPHLGMIYISYFGITKWEAVEVIKPYLRPISSMTEEEDKKRIELGIWINTIKGNKVTAIDKNVDEALEWLNKKMFAYRTIDGKDMFELGLALEAPEGMYKENN